MRVREHFVDVACGRVAVRDDSKFKAFTKTVDSGAARKDNQADNARYLNPSSVTLSANALGPELNDILQKVDFFVDGSLAGTVTAAPWTFSLPSPALGTHTLTAIATDSQGATTTSAARTIVVSDTNLAPTVSIVTPLDNSNWHSPAGFMFQASANSGEANDTVSVEFYLNGALQGTDSSSPYSINLSSLAAGTYTLMAKAIDGQGAQTSSVTRTVTVSDANAVPIVNITAPSGGTNYPTAPAGFTITATANAGEVNGWITRVEFYLNGNLVNTDTAGPWSYPVSGLANGTYQLTAKAVDQLGGETTSAPITITVGPQAKGYFIHVDHLNTPRAIYDDQQQLRWKWEQQEPFGANVPDENPSSLGAFEFALRFPGQYFDKETNLYYNYIRDYDPAVGRYTQSDPIGLAGGVNTYLYGIGQPLLYVDPTGENPLGICVAALVGGFLVGYYGPDVVVALANFSQSATTMGNLSGSRAGQANQCAAGDVDACSAAAAAQQQLVPAAGQAVQSGADVVQNVGQARMVGASKGGSYMQGGAPAGNPPRYPNFPNNNKQNSGPYAPGYTR